MSDLISRIDEHIASGKSLDSDEWHALVNEYAIDALDNIQAAQATSATPFAWNNSYDDTEQMRPYLDDFNRLHDELEAAGKYPYNDSFKGKIPGVMDAPNPRHEDTGIYMLQRLRDQDEITRKEQQFLNSDGFELDLSQPFEHGPGTLVITRFYSGGTGYSERKVSKVKIDTEKRRVLFKEARQRNWRANFSGGKCFYRPDPR